MQRENAMIKKSDLQIGDWVELYFRMDDERNCIAQITEIHSDSVRTNVSGGDPIYFDDILSIPLTPEILEKNGFDWGYTTSEEDFCSAVGCGYPEEKGWCFDEGAGEIKIIFPNDTDGGLIRLDDQCVDRHLEILFLKPIYVHELQHALRLCGIEKEIEL